MDETNWPNWFRDAFDAVYQVLPAWASILIDDELAEVLFVDGDAFTARHGAEAAMYLHHYVDAPGQTWRHRLSVPADLPERVGGWGISAVAATIRAILAHELAHVALRHGMVRQVRRAAGLSLTGPQMRAVEAHQQLAASYQALLWGFDDRAARLPARPAGAPRRRPRVVRVNAGHLRR